MEIKIGKYSFIKILFSIILIMFIFNNGLDNARDLAVFNIPIKYSYVIIIFLEFIALLYIIFINKEIKIDFIAVLLVLKIVLYTFMLLYEPNSINNLKPYLSVIQSVILYVIMISIPTYKTKNFIKNFMKFYFIIICVQTIYITISTSLSGVEFWRIKQYVQIPIGGSNFIASTIILLFAFIICNEEKGYKSNILIAISIIGMFFTRSKSAIVILVLLIISEFFSFSNIKRNKKKFIMGIFSIMFLIIVIKVLNDNFPDFFNTYTNMYNNLLSDNESGTEMAFNGRFSIYDRAIDILQENFLFGIGLDYSAVVGMLAHNFILDNMLNAGIFNLILLIMYFGICGLRFFQNSKSDNLIKGSGKMLFFVLIHGLFEPNIGGFIFDFPMWIIIGIGMRRYYELKEERLGKSIDEN